MKSEVNLFVDLRANYLNMRAFLIVLGLTTFQGSPSFAIPMMMQLANRCEYLMGGTRVLEKVEFTTPPIQSQFQEILSKLQPEQKSEIRRILQTLQSSAHRETNPKTRDSLQYYLRMMHWSLENNPADFRDTSHIVQVRDLYMRLKTAQQNFQVSGKSLEPGWLDYTSKTLRGLQVLSRLKDGPTYETLARIAADYSLAISKLYAGPILPAYEANYERSYGSAERDKQFFSGRSHTLEKIMTIAPMVYLRHFKDLTLQDFTDSFFFPELKLGLVDTPVTFDGRTHVSDDGNRHIEAYATPAYFYEHDFGNHGMKMLPRQYLSESKNPMLPAEIKITPTMVIEAFRQLQQQYYFHLYIVAKKSKISAAHRDAVDAILMYIYHEAPDQFFERSSEFTLNGLQNVLQKRSSDDLGRQKLVSTLAIENSIERIYKNNDIGQDLPHLKNLPKEKQKMVLEEAVQWLLSLN